ncbi:MAG: DUF1129 family protein [Lactobacillus sp.]|nr:DUF1129 domain-containing protein [Lactobacillus sp.]MDN6053012.1 DUF1129 domain-containing protein [Lactobacillus sp.]
MTKIDEQQPVASEPTEPAGDLRAQLSNKNNAYVFRLQKELELQGSLTTEAAQARVTALLPEILTAQRRGQTARALYLGTPKQAAARLLHPELDQPAQPAPFWQRAVDSALLYLAIFTGIFGLMNTFQKTAANGQMGVLSIASVGILMGVFMTKYEDWVLPNGAKGKISWLKLILVSLLLVGGFMVWIFILSLNVIKVINPVLPGMWYVLIAVIAYGVRWYFRKYYGITGSTLGGARMNSQRK